MTGSSAKSGPERAAQPLPVIGAGYRRREGFLPIQARRIIDENGLAQVFRAECREKVNELAVVGHLLDVWMRKVRSP